ncbi:MAG: hypothetical protein M1813_004441 [Trichoglossum hirsutum]|nr:MAG: hypothetical protein M1813_004441 [Trichoglossum hirsutum]
MFSKTTFIIYSFLFFFRSITLATPDLGIQRDWLTSDTKSPPSIISFSGIIEFNDELPMDTSRMTDQKLVNLGKVAFERMLVIHQEKLGPTADLPNAMITLAVGKRIYFASSMRGGDGVDFTKVHDPASGISKVFQSCVDEMGGTHAHGGACGEPNVLALYWEANKQDPPKDPRPRIAAWVRVPGEDANFPPCKTRRGTEVYGCETLLIAMGLSPVSNKAPDNAGQDSWQFQIVPNPRKPCA